MNRRDALLTMQSGMDQINASCRDWFNELTVDQQSIVVVKLLDKHALHADDKERAMEIGLALLGVCNLIVSALEQEAGA